MSKNYTAMLDDLTVHIFTGHDGKTVVEIDGLPSSQGLRVHVNEGRVFEAEDLDEEETYRYGPE